METREKIMEQTFRLLLRKGYDGVSVSDIQSSLSISRGLLYHYFGNKELLFLESIRHELATGFFVDLELIKDYTIQEMIRYIVEKYRFLDEELLQDASVLDYDFLFYRALRESEQLAKLYVQSRSEEQQAWLVALRNSMDRGELRDGLDLEKVALQYIYTSDGVWISAVTPTLEINLITSLKDALDGLTALILK